MALLAIGRLAGMRTRVKARCRDARGNDGQYRVAVACLGMRRRVRFGT